jgi:hypothetical protein
MQQTNTANMLNEVVEYVKLLQKKVQVCSLSLFSDFDTLTDPYGSNMLSVSTIRC